LEALQSREPPQVFDPEGRERELDFIASLQEELAQARVDLAKRLPQLEMPKTESATMALLENLVNRVTALEDENSNITLLTHRWPAATTVAAQLAKSENRSEAMAKKIRIAVTRTMGPQVKT